MRYVVMVGVLCAAAAAAPQAQDAAQVAKQAAEMDAIKAKVVQNLRVSVESRITKNAPYSAEAVTESVQALADGNRIVTKSTTRIFRDSEGRTRREQLNPAGTDAVTINISDPIAGTTYVLDPATHMAFRNGLIFTTASGQMEVGSLAPGGRGVMTMTRAPEGGGGAVVVREAGQKEAAEGQAVATAKATSEFYARSAGSGGGGFIAEGVLPAKIGEPIGKTTREELGQQTIEGVTAVGTRSTTEIAAGAIGNEQPIKVVSEQWYSSDLQVLVLTKHNDPRVGETVYRLVGIVRAEPARSLFELPPDYTLKESAIRRQER
jgi:hypothetical protein